MFQLALLQETVRIMPSEFGKTIVTAVTDALNEKYPNKVQPQQTPPSAGGHVLTGGATRHCR